MNGAINDVGDEINGKVEVNDGDGVLFNALLADIDGVEDNASSALSMCTEDINEVERGIPGLSEEETI